MRRHLARSRAEAQTLISEGLVIVKGVPTPKPATLVGADTPIDLVSNERRWVSRGALKLLRGLEVFPIEVAGRRALDVGASTGGFTEVLLDAGAIEVVALDVGRGQLHERLRADDRVVVLERCNFRNIDVDSIGGPFGVVVADLSFISLCTVAPNLSKVARSDADMVVLVKPQFEASREKVRRRGVVVDDFVRREAVSKVAGCMGDSGLHTQGLVVSPIRGSDGNVEYLLWLRKDRPAVDVEVTG